MKILNDAFCLRLSIVAGYLFLILFVAYFGFSLADRDKTIRRMNSHIIHLEGELDTRSNVWELKLHTMTLQELYDRIGIDSDGGSR